MGWKTINGRRYYYQSEREGGRVKTTFFGAGESGLLISILVRAEREAERDQRRAEREEYRAEFGLSRFLVLPWPGRIGTGRAGLRLPYARLVSDRYNPGCERHEPMASLGTGLNGTTSVEGVDAELVHKQFIESFGG